RSERVRPAACGCLRAGNRSGLPGDDEVDLRGSAEAVLSGVPLAIAQIPTTSPTMAEVMRSCALRAGLSRCEGARAFTLGNPKAWLGTAYHEVLEKLAETDVEDDALDAKVEELWTAAIGVQHQRAMAHGLDSRFGAPPTWPGYHLAYAAVRLRAKEMVASRREAARKSAARANVGESTPAIREQRFTACDGKLVGRPDVISGDEIIDYKSGAIREFD